MHIALSRSSRALLLALCSPVLVAAQSGVASRPVEGSALTADSAHAKKAPIAATKTPARPDFKSLRFDESWTPATRTAHWDDGIKAIPLAPLLTLTIGGQARVREEFAHAFTFTDVSDTYELSRILLHADLQAGTPKLVHARVYGEFRDAQAFNRDLPGGTRPSDGDRSDVQNLFVDVGVARSWVRYGRQEVVANRERLIGVPDWSNTRRGFEGTRAMLVFRNVAFDVLDARPVIVRLNQSNIADSTTRFRVVSFGSAPGAQALASGLPTAWQVYRYDQTITTATVTHRMTTGGRAQWTFGGRTKASRTYSVESEGAVQRGTVGAKLIRAWFWTAELQAQWRAVRGAPSLAIGVEEASGDRNAADNEAQAFNMLYTAAHAHGGYADVFGRANAIEKHLISTWDPFKRLNLRGSWHRYDRLTLDDGVYTKQNTVLRAASGSLERHAGDEIDITGTIAATRHLKFIAGHAWIRPGEFLRQTPGGARDSRWGFLGTTFTF